jgi:hypothetical protein
MREGCRTDRIADGLGAPGEADVRMVIDDRADVLPHLRVRLDDEHSQAGAVG